MDYPLACICGNVLAVSEGMAGSSATCPCGRTVPVPSLGELRGEAITPAGPAPFPDMRLTDEPPPESPSPQAITAAVPPAAPAFLHADSSPLPTPYPLAEILPPTPVLLRTGPGRPERAVAALTEDALWIQEVWRLRRIPLRELGRMEVSPGGAELTLAPDPEISDGTLTLVFTSAAEAERWCGRLREQRHELRPDAPEEGRQPPEGVALLRQPPAVPRVHLGPVQFTGRNSWDADRGIQLRAGMRGANAVVDVYRHKGPDTGSGGCHVSGLAVRFEGADAERLPQWWYDGEVRPLFKRMLLLLVVQAALLLAAGVFAAGLVDPTGETMSQTFVFSALGLGLLFTWPLLLVILLRALSWPPLLRAAGLAVLAATTGRGLAVWLASLLAVRDAGAAGLRARSGLTFCMLVDPFEWAFIILGAVLGLRAWRLAGAARRILPPDAQAGSAARKLWAGGLLGITGVYLLAFAGFAAATRYEASAHLLQPGVDPRREHQALLAMNEGSAHADKGDLASAEQSYQRALRLWEQLTEGRQAPTVYRMNLANTLHNLAWIRHSQGRLDEAETYYARTVGLADRLRGRPDLGDDFEQNMALARKMLDDLRAQKLARALDEKDRQANRKYEEAIVKAERGEADAERLCEQALALWEEILPKATSPEYRKTAPGRLAGIYLWLGELQLQRGKRARAEASLRKAVEHGERAVADNPDGPLPRRHLDVARRLLKQLRK